MDSTYLPVLMYHDIGPSAIGAAPNLTVASDAFEAHVAWLAGHGYIGIGAADCMAWVHEGKALPKKPVLITFDDGYAGVAAHALPALERRAFGATVFIVTSRIGGSSVWDQELGYAAIPLMTRRDIVNWAARGFDFGCHTRTHQDLALLSEADIEREVAGSRDELAAVIDRLPIAFAYPWGSVNQSAHRCVQKHFALGFSSRRGLNFRGTDRHLLRRTAVHPNRSKLDFALRMMFGLNPLARLEARWRSRSRG